MSLQPARLAEVEGLDGEDEKSRRYLALLPDIAATPDKPAEWSAVWSSLGNTLDTLSEDEFKMRFKASSIGRKLAASAAQADFDATLQAYYARFVAYGHASTEDFARDARRLSILAAIFLAIGANIDAFDLLETYIAQPTHRAAIIARYEQGDRQLPTTPSAAPASPESGKPGAARLGGTALRGRLIVMRRDGSDGEAITLSGELFDIGRSAANKNFTDDPFLAARHVRFVMHGGGVRVRPVDLVNGVFIQLREPYELQAGDVFYIGRELIRYEPLPPEERDPTPAIEHGVRVFGSTPRESWARLRQLTTSALVRDVWHLSRAEVLLGREEGDIVFPDDEFMSRRHALITRVGGRVRLEDQHSSNGTYVRLRGERDVQPNDVLRVGDQVLRYEP